MGTPVTFVRFAGCNLDCPWCDTKDQLRNGKSINMDAETIVGEVHKKHVVLTGGEPTLYDLDPLLDLLADAGHVIMIETNGTGRVSPKIDYVACSPKRESCYDIHGSILERERSGRAVDYKYVIDQDILLDNIHLPFRGSGSIVYLQPEYYSFADSMRKAQNLSELLEPVADVRLGIQAHKYGEVR